MAAVLALEKWRLKPDSIVPAAANAYVACMILLGHLLGYHEAGPGKATGDCAFRCKVRTYGRVVMVTVMMTMQ